MVKEPQTVFQKVVQEIGEEAARLPG